jgi:hypothetical protein
LAGIEAMIVQLAGELVIELGVDVQNGRRARLDGRKRETLFVKRSVLLVMLGRLLAAITQ